MARVIYLDCFSGIAGDMFLAAAIDAGLPVDGLARALGSLGVGHEIVTSRVTRAGISATHLDVVSHAEKAGVGHAHPHGPDDDNGSHRSLAQIARLIDDSALSASARARAKGLFRRLGAAEAAIHDVAVEDVHLHEVGAVDSIIDLCGAVYAMEWFRPEEVVVSPLNVGGGTVRIAHGVYPVPAPATVRLLAGVPVYSTGLQAELVTPTGALLVSEYATSYGPMPSMTIERSGYGAGTKDFADVPNVLRLVIGQRETAAAGDIIVEIKCEIDDMNPQLYGPLMDRLLEAGALDVFFTAVQMKKSRPGTLVTILAPPAGRDAVAGVLFAETTTIGMRYQEMRRETLSREVVTLETPMGAIRFKVASRDGHVLNVSPEFDDCVRVAAEKGLPLKEVHALALASWMHR